MRVSEFDFELPEKLIALHPAEPRDSARLLVVRPGEALEDRHIPDLLKILRPGSRSRSPMTTRSGCWSRLR